ncbi:MAG TPA: tetratricopeptide repeat protein, partial [Trueperaceae bacterium]|nr:tetratricopeptide repeat protein [Trueperaceae bacterium]
YLLWALVVSLVLLVVLQLVFSARGPSAGGATYEAGLAPYRSGDFSAAQNAWQSAAANGDPRAQYMLGYLVQNGLGQPWSNRRAAEWYHLAAAQGLPEAQAALANLYLEGLGVQPDAERGVALLREAAAAGHPPALFQYAQLLFHGRWVAQDFEAALTAFEAAAAGGSAAAADYVDLANYLRPSPNAPQPLAQE